MKLTYEQAEALYKDNERLAGYAIQRYYPQHSGDEDYLQEAKYALWRACQDFDPDGAAKISHFAVTYIVNWFRRLHHTESMQKRFNVYGADISLYTAVRAPNGVSADDIDDFAPLNNIAASTDIEWLDWNSFMSSLNETDRLIVKDRLSGLTLREIGNRLGMSHQGVQQRLWKVRRTFDKYI